MVVNSIIHSHESNPLPTENSQVSHFHGKIFRCSNKWKPLFIALIIIGLCSFAAGGSLAAPGLISINSIAFISLEIIGGSLFITGIIGHLVLYYKKQGQGSHLKHLSKIRIEEKKLPDQSMVEKKPDEAISSWKLISSKDPDCWLFITSSLCLGRNIPLITVENTDFVFSSDLKLGINNHQEEFSLFIKKLHADPVEIVQIKICKNLVNEVFFNGQKLNTFSEISPEFIGAIERIYLHFLKTSSTYQYRLNNNSQIAIQVYQPGLKIIPEFHLEKLTHFKFHPNIRFKLVFINANHTKKKSLDFGGLSRDFLDDLMGAIVNLNFAFQEIKNNTLFFPSFQRNIDDIILNLKDIPITSSFELFLKKKNTLPLLNLNETSIYHQVGKVFMLCHQSSKDDYAYLTGYRFDPAIFHALLALTPEEINTPFDQLNWETLLKICKALLDGSEHESYRQLCAILLNESPSMDDLTKGAQFLLDTYEINNEEFNFLSNPQNISSLKNKLFIYLLTTSSSLGILCFRLASIHAIAQGMMNSLILNKQTWEMVISSENPNDLSLKIQGVINRKQISDNFVLSKDLDDKPEEARNQVNIQLEWLKNWILNGATDEELKKIFKFITGSSSVPYNIKIQVHAQEDEFFPGIKGHTCFYEIELPPHLCSYGKYSNNTYDDFITTLKDIVLQNINYSDK